MERGPRACRQDQAAIRRLRKGHELALELRGITQVNRNNVDADRSRHGLDDGELTDTGGYGGVAKDSCSRRLRRDLFKQCRPFSAQAVFEYHESSRVAARPRQALDIAGTDRIRNER